MEITFSIKYKAEHGQRLCVSGAISELGAWEEAQSLLLSPAGSDRWTGSVAVDGRKRDLVYYYLVRDSRGETLRREWKRMHHLCVRSGCKNVYMDDRWVDRPGNSPFYSSAFYDVFFRHEPETIPTSPELEERLVIQVYAPAVPRCCRLYIVGSISQFGDWDPYQAVPMYYIGKGEWQITVPRPTEGQFEFKFIILNPETGRVHRWEAGDNRSCILPERDYDYIFVTGMTFQEDGYRPHFAGVAIPLFSLRSRADYGIGDFGSLRLAVDWAASMSLHILQLLPLCDTTYYRDYRDSYPYNAISVDSIHPIYIDLAALPPLRNGQLRSSFEDRAKVLRLSPTLLYPQVIELKEEYLREHYAEYGSSVIKKKDYRHFVQSNAMWLTPYIAFCMLRDGRLDRRIDEWQPQTQMNDAELMLYLDQACYREEANYYRYVQYIAHTQLLSVGEYAEKKGVVLKGDIAIGVSPQGSDVFYAPELYHMEQSAGAPPDDFAREGQNWGFPTYDWERMKQDDYFWWRHRFERLSVYFKAFRIDHVLGFFRIWEIPRTQVSGLLGHFSPAYPEPLEYWADSIPFSSPIKWLTEPCIHIDDLRELLGKHFGALLEQGYIIPYSRSKYYHLKYTKQRDYESIDYFPCGELARRALVDLCTEVALVQDPYRPTHYHPRIGWERSLGFARWSRELQQCWQEVANKYFYHTHLDLWRSTGYNRLLPLLGSTEMLVCAEDLGMIPSCVPEVLDELLILTLELERMPKELTESGLTDLQRLPYHSVCTTSTHDMPPLRLWWKRLSQEEQRRYILDVLQPHFPYIDVDKCSDEEVFSCIILRHITSPSMLTILPLSDWMSLDKRLHLQAPIDEQINDPSNPHQRWEYRMPLSLESLMTDYPEWQSKVRQMLLSILRD